MSNRQLTLTEKVLVEKIASSSSQGVLTASRPSVRVNDEMDEQGRVQWTVSVPLSEILPDA